MLSTCSHSVFTCVSDFRCSALLGSVCLLSLCRQHLPLDFGSVHYSVSSYSQGVKSIEKVSLGFSLSV